MPNLLQNIPTSLPAEQFLTLLTRPGVRIERIVSTGQSDPPGVHELGEDGAAGVVDSGGNRLPGGDLGVRVETGRRVVPPGGGRGLDPLGNDEPGAGPLPVVERR